MLTAGALIRFVLAPFFGHTVLGLPQDCGLGSVSDHVEAISHKDPGVAAMSRPALLIGMPADQTAVVLEGNTVRGNKVGKSGGLGEGEWTEVSKSKGKRKDKIVPK